MIFNVTGGGGTALNFKVQAYASEEAMLAAQPKENTIGIITETPITSWIFSATEPSPAEAGMVWIIIGTSSTVEFNALKKNGIQVYPISAKQYVSSTWVDKTAKSYQGGEWVDWLLCLYKEGDEYLDITGGWVAKAKGLASVTNHNAPALTKNADCMTVYEPQNGYNGNDGVLETANTIDLTGYTSLNFDVEGTGTYSKFRLGVFESINNNFTIIADVTIEIMTDPATIPRNVYSLDISNLNGKYNVGVYLYNANTAKPISLNVYNVWLA